MQSGVNFLLLITTKTDLKNQPTLIQLSSWSDSNAVNQSRVIVEEEGNVCGKVIVAVLDMLSCAAC